MKNKRFLVLVSIICLALILVALPLVAACEEEEAPPAGEEEEEEEVTPPETIIWRCDCHIKARQITPLADPYEKFVNNIYERSGGQLKIETHWSSELGLSYADFLKNLQKGLVEMSETAFPSASKYVPDLAYSSIAYISGTTYDWPTYLEALKARRPIYDELFAEWDAKLLVEFPYLPDIVCGTDIISTIPIRGVEDFDGVKVKCTTPEQAELWEQFGAINVPVDTPEIYTAVKTGMVDAIVWSRDTMLDWKLYEVCPYLIEVFPVKEKYYDFGWAVTIDAWNKLTPDLQQIVSDACKEYQDEIDWQIANRGTEFLPPREEELREVMEEWGMTIIKFPADDQAKVLEFAEDLIVKWLAEAGDLGLRLFKSDMEAMGQMERYERIMQLVEEYAGE
jgi:TRAP-type C4-dicarboxylate transport system substrate-binding protein